MCGKVGARESAVVSKAWSLIRLWLAAAWRVILFPLGPNRARRRHLYHAYEHLRASLPVVKLETVLGQTLPDLEEVRLRAVTHRAHNCSIFELLVLAALTRMLDPRRCFEIGTYDGRSALAIALNLRGDATLATLNLPPDYLERHTELAGSTDVRLSTKVESGERWRGHAEADRIHQLFGNSKDFDFSPFAPCQLIFIDGGHDETTVSSDSRNALEIIDRHNGAILWHDATHYGVGHYLPKLSAKGYPIYTILGTDMALLRFSDGQPVVWT
jgi:predicted O-methyltransferase YrrM